MGSAASTGSEKKTHPNSHSSTLPLCALAMGNGGAGSQATPLPSTQQVVVFGGGAAFSISAVGELPRDSSFVSMRINAPTGGPIPTITGHTLTGLTGRKCVVLGGMMDGRRNTGVPIEVADSRTILSSPNTVPSKVSFGSGWILSLGGRPRRSSGTFTTNLINSSARGSKNGEQETSTWTRQQFLGQPPIRRAHHTANRVLVGENERLVIYGGEVGIAMSNTSSGRDSGERGRGSDASTRKSASPFPYMAGRNIVSCESPSNLTSNTVFNGEVLTPTKMSTFFGSNAVKDGVKDGGASRGGTPRSKREVGFDDGGGGGGGGDASENENRDESEGLTPLRLSQDDGSRSRPSLSRTFKEEDDDDGILYILDCTSWVWKAGTCASETTVLIPSDDDADDEDDPYSKPTSRSFYPPARARHTATSMTPSGDVIIVFGGHKTKAQYNNPQEEYNHEEAVLASSAGQPLNDVWRLKTIVSENGGRSRGQSSVRFLWKMLKTKGLAPVARWGHTSVNIESGAMCIYGGSNNNVDLNGTTNPLIEMKAAMDDIFVLHLAESVFTTSSSGGGKTPLAPLQFDGGEGLWVRVPGDCGWGRRVCPSSTVIKDAIIVFGGIRGEDQKKKQLNDAKIIPIANVLATLTYELG